MREIPRIIHYCWFGKNPLPDSAKTCIESWKKFCPDYQIIEWNEDNYDINTCEYVREAYRNKKWAFVSDYARYDILYREGGLYFDTDVELIRPIDDIIKEGSFIGCEKGFFNNGWLKVNPGVGIGAIAGLPFYKEVLEFYSTQHFEKNGIFNQTTIVEYTTTFLVKNGLRNYNGIQKIGDITIYPWQYFGPMDYVTGDIEITDETRSIHHYTASWLEKEDVDIYKAERLIAAKIGCRMSKLVIIPYKVTKKIKKFIRVRGLWGGIEYAIKKTINNL